MLKNYNPKKVLLTWGSIQVVGYMEGTFLSAERNEDSFEESVGADGNVTRVRNLNRTGLVTCTLQAESVSNDALSAQAAIDELSGVAVAPLSIKDLNGTTLVEGAEAWLKRPANVEFADTASSREWTWGVAELFMNIGGALV